MPTYSAIPEWAPQRAVLLAWPKPEHGWQPQLKHVEASIAALTAALSQIQTVWLLVDPSLDQEAIRHQLAQAGAQSQHCQLISQCYNDSWCRDYGPIASRDRQGRIRLLDFQFDGWNNKYPSHNDTAVNQALYAQGLFNPNWLQSIDWVFEGGAMEVNGQGTLLLNRPCVLTQRNQGALSQAQFEDAMHHLLGIQQFHWLDIPALAGDDTDGHIDTLARFISDDTLCYQACDDPTDINYASGQQLQQQLQQLRQPNGQPYRLIPLPTPATCQHADGSRLPATYANFLLLNQHLIYPCYGSPIDAVAAQCLQAALPDYQLVGIDCRPIIEQYGSLHCLTMQIPA